MSDYKIETKCIQSGYEPGNGEARVLPIYQSTTFKYSSSEQMGRLFDLEESGYFYTRLQNPTNDAVAAKICDMEGGAAAMLTSSGQAANYYAIFNICEAGDHFICSNSIYGGTFNLFGTTMKKQGISCTFINPDASDEEIEAAFLPNTKAVFAETISNSVIRCGGTVYAMSGRGMIADCQIQAGDSVLCVRIGNLAGGRSQFSVGYPPRIPESWKRLKAEVANVQSTFEKLWEPITTLRKRGSRISEGEAELLEQLVEQRELCMEKRESLTAELRIVNKALDRKSKGRIRCEKLYPVLDVQIGRSTEEITTIEEGCNIHVEESRILLK